MTEAEKILSTAVTSQVNVKDYVGEDGVCNTITLLKLLTGVDWSTAVARWIDDFGSGGEFQHSSGVTAVVRYDHPDDTPMPVRFTDGTRTVERQVEYQHPKPETETEAEISIPTPEKEATVKTADLLVTLPVVSIAAADRNFTGTYERDENGIINAIVDGFEVEDPDDEEEVATCNFLTRVLNEQYTIIHDNFGAEAAEKANYGWVMDDDLIATKIRAVNSWSVIETQMDDDEKTITSHVVKLMNDDGDYEDPVVYTAGNAAVTG